MAPAGGGNFVASVFTIALKFERTAMARISELMIAHPEMTSFVELERRVVEAARQGEIHLYMDIKPEYADTPRKWEHVLEKAFYDAESTPR
jgi:hypothetical protein